jgi:peptidoglycan/LPS O-acetylase OafA/YrhL
MNYRYDIQGLRAIAVLLVFIFHLNSDYLSGGFIGVDIFFVISGYLVSKIILQKMDSTEKKFSLTDFYLGRFRRLLPVYLVFLIVTLIIGSFVYLSIDINSLRKNVFWSTIFNSNYYLSTLDDYFGAKSSENPFLHTWTLSIEMQFYFLLPIYLLFVNRKYLLSLTLLIAILLLSYSYYNIEYLSNKSSMYFSFPARIPEFLIGVIFGIISQSFAERFNKFREILSWIAFSILIASSIIFSEKLNFPGIIVLIPCLATAILLCLPDSNFNKKVLGNKLLVHLGEISYSVYLWHWPIMAYMRYYNNRYSFTWLEIILVTVLTYSLSFISYKFFEVKYRKIDNKKIFFHYGAFLIVLICFLYLSPRFNLFNQNIPLRFIKPTFGVESHSNSFKKVEFIGDVQLPSDSILLIGDSHALVYKSILDEIGKKGKFNLKTLTNDRYPNIPGIRREDFSSTELYAQYSKIVENTVAEIQNSRIIMISSVWFDQINSLPEALEKFIKYVGPHKQIIILSDFPVLDMNPIKMNRSFLKNRFINNEYQVSLKNLPKYVIEISRKYSNVYILDLNFEKIIKDIPFNNDTIMYYDAGHLNDYGARVVGKHVGSDFIRKFKLIER